MCDNSKSNMKAIRKNLKMLPDHNDMLHKEHEGWLDEWDQNMTIAHDCLHEARKCSIEMCLGNGVGTAMQQIAGTVAKWKEEKADRLKQWQEEMRHMTYTMVDEDLSTGRIPPGPTGRKKLPMHVLEKNSCVGDRMNLQQVHEAEGEVFEVVRTSRQRTMERRGRDVNRKEKRGGDRYTNQIEAHPTCKACIAKMIKLGMTDNEDEEEEPENDTPKAKATWDKVLPKARPSGGVIEIGISAVMRLESKILSTQAQIKAAKVELSILGTKIIDQFKDLRAVKAALGMQ
ncbi:hypothetical protein V8E55_007185 [Tylopilus felleus]